MLRMFLSVLVYGNLAALVALWVAGLVGERRDRREMPGPVR